MITNCLLAFFGGAIYESTCVAWVHHAERGNALKASSVSMFAALCTIVGLGESIHNTIAAPFFILGYGIGTYVAISYKNRKKIYDGNK